MMRRTKEAKTPESEKGLALPSLWEPATTFRAIERWMDDLRQDFESSFWTPFRGFVGWDVRRPLVDVEDAGTEFVVKAELPGVSKEDVEITVTPDAVELRAKADAERKEEKADYLFRERTHSEFARTIALPAEVRADEAKASLRDGELEIRLPKKEPTPPAKPVKVPVA